MTTVLSFIFVLGVLIFFHELGHFLIAKRVGIRVDKFSLGFPPNIFRKKIGGTTYCIGAIPLGGYVKMAGENPDEATVGSSDEFMSKTPVECAVHSPHGSSLLVCQLQAIPSPTGRIC